MRPRPKGRLVFSRGPIIWTLLSFSAATACCAIAALVVSLSAQGHRLDATDARINFVQSARHISATDTCLLITGLVEAGPNAGRARAYLKRSELANCDTYGRLVAAGVRIRLPRAR